MVSLYKNVIGAKGGSGGGGGEPTTDASIVYHDHVSVPDGFDATNVESTTLELAFREAGEYLVAIPGGAGTTGSGTQLIDLDKVSYVGTPIAFRYLGGTWIASEWEHIRWYYISIGIPGTCTFDLSIPTFTIYGVSIIAWKATNIDFLLDPDKESIIGESPYSVTNEEGDCNVTVATGKLLPASLTGAGDYDVEPVLYDAEGDRYFIAASQSNVAAGVKNITHLTDGSEAASALAVTMVLPKKTA